MKAAQAKQISQESFDRYAKETLQAGQRVHIRHFFEYFDVSGKKTRDIIYKQAQRSKYLENDPRQAGWHYRVDPPIQLNSQPITNKGSESHVLLPLGIKDYVKLRQGQMLLISGSSNAGKSIFCLNTIKLNYKDHKILAFITNEKSVEDISDEFAQIGIPFDDPKIRIFRPELGYLNAIKGNDDLVVVDYQCIGPNQTYLDIRAQHEQILRRIGKGVAIVAIQKHPGMDRPEGGQYAIHKPHHVVMLDELGDQLRCTLFKVKNDGKMKGQAIKYTVDPERATMLPDGGWFRREDKIKWSVG